MGSSAPVVVPLSSVLISFGFAVLAGTFFGIYPARNSSRLDTIEAPGTRSGVRPRGGLGGHYVAFTSGNVAGNAYSVA